MSDESDTADFLEVVFGDTEGWACTAVGQRPYRDEHGKYKHENWSERAFQWPAQRDQLVEFIIRAAELGDVYYCPYLMKTASRAKGNAVSRVLIHSDVDQDFDPADIEALSGFAIYSGTPGHGHVYVPLAWPVTPDQHEALCRGLAAKLGGDAKYADNDLLRPPGTFNYKSTLEGGDPSRVRS